jgi:hypothetical protein
MQFNSVDPRKSTPFPVIITLAVASILASTGGNPEISDHRLAVLIFALGSVLASSRKAPGN